MFVHHLPILTLYFFLFLLVILFLFFFFLFVFLVFFFFFFFQAEDGIRDLTVTGVQTCALPIFGASLVLALTLVPLLSALVLRPRPAGRHEDVWLVRRVKAFYAPLLKARSEERRVGKSVDLGGRRIIKTKKNKRSRESKNEQSTE